MLFADQQDGYSLACERPYNHCNISLPWLTGGFLEREVDNRDKYLVNVKKCFYHNFFVANEVPQLTPIFCDFDNVWGDELKKKGINVRFDRPETMGYGGDMCKFQFTRIDPK